MRNSVLLLVIIILLTFGLTGCLMSNKVYEYWEFDYDVKDIQYIQIVEITEEFNSSYRVIKEIESSKTQEVCDDVTALSMYTFALSMESPIEPYGICILIMYNTGEYDIIADSGSKKYRYDEKTGLIENPTSWRYCEDEEFEALIDKYLN